MNYNPQAFTKGNSEGRDDLARRPRSILIYGQFRSSLGLEQVEMLKLGSALIDKGHVVETVSPSSSPLAKRVMNFRTPVKFAKSKAFLKRYDHVVIFAPLSATAHFRSSHIWGKTKEWFRAQQFLRALQNAGRQVHWIRTPARNAMLPFLSFAPTKSMNHPADPSGEIYAHITGETLIATDLFSAQDTLIEHAHFSDADQRISPRSIRRYLTGINSTDAVLLTLCDMASARALRRTSIVKLLRKTTQSPAQYLTHSDPPYPLIDIAMTRDKTTNLPKYVSHLIKVFKIADRFDLSSPLGQKSALDWYNRSAREKMSHCWVPQLPRAPRQWDDAPCDHQAMETFLNSFGNTALSDLRLKQLLLTKRDPDGPTAMAILLAMLCRLPLGGQAQQNPWASQDINSWFAQAPLALAPQLRHFASPAARPTTQPKFAEIAGFTNDTTGLARNMTMSVQAIEKIDLSYVTRDVEAVKPLIDPPPKLNNRIKKRFAIHHVNADRVPMGLLTPEKAYRNDVYNIGYFLWETSKIPDAHRLGMDLVDEIWTPTEFVATLYKNAGARNVIKVGKAIPELRSLERLAKIYRPDPRKFTFFSAFDFHSSVERKNPMAIVRAFQNTFPRHTNHKARLILKSTPSQAKHWGDPNGQMHQIRKAVKQDNRIQFIEHMLPLDALFKLMAKADCIVSAHRGEGFGYFPAYGLGLAKPTIVTDWGGVTDFCTTMTSFPVNANLVEVPDGHSIYPAQGACWADIDVDALGQTMRRVFEQPEYAKKRGLAGQRFVQDAYSMDRLAGTYETRLKQIGLL